MGCHVMLKFAYPIELKFFSPGIHVHRETWNLYNCKHESRNVSDHFPHAWNDVDNMKLKADFDFSIE